MHAGRFVVALAPNFDYVLLIPPDELSAAQVPRYREIARGRTFVLGQISARSAINAGWR